jgi:hypothetical protein
MWCAGLCNECYVRAKDRPPLHVDPYTVPGVSREKRAKEQQQDTINDDDEGLVGGKPKLCRWQPDRHNNEELKYTCTNPVFRNVLKHKFESFCAYHLPICWEAVRSLQRNHACTLTHITFPPPLSACIRADALSIHFLPTPLCRSTVTRIRPSC